MKNLTDSQKENIRKWYTRLLKPDGLKKMKKRLFKHTECGDCACFLGVACLVTNTLLEDGQFVCPMPDRPEDHFRCYEAPQTEWFQTNFGFAFRAIAVPEHIRLVAQQAKCCAIYGRYHVADLNDNTGLKFKDMAEILAFNFPWLTEPVPAQ